MTKIVSGTVQFTPNDAPSRNEAIDLLSQVMADAGVKAQRDGVTDPAEVKKLMLEAAQRLVYGVS